MLDDLTQQQRERLFYLELKAFFCGDLTRLDIENRFGIKPAASARDLITYRQIAPNNLTYNATQRHYVTTDSFKPLFQHTPERVLEWFKSGLGDNIDRKLKRSIPCESASDLVRPDIKTLAILTRAIASRKLVKINYLSLTSGLSTKTIAPLALADTGLRWHVRAYDQGKMRYADFVLTRIVNAVSLDKNNPQAQQIESDTQWARVVRLEIVPHPCIRFPEAIEADYKMENGVLSIDMRAPLVGYALRRWNVDCTANHSLDSSIHHLWLRNPQTLYRVDSAALAPGYANLEALDEHL